MRIGIFHCEKDVVVGRDGGVVDHGFDAYSATLLHAIAVAGDFDPVGEFAACAENVLFLIWAEKIGAIGVPERGVMEHDAGDSGAVGVNEARCVCARKTAGRDGPDEVGMLRTIIVSRIGGDASW